MKGHTDTNDISAFGNIKKGNDIAVNLELTGPDSLGFLALQAAKGRAAAWLVQELLRKALPQRAICP
jgi:hypothetical protein